MKGFGGSGLLGYRELYFLWPIHVMDVLCGEYQRSPHLIGHTMKRNSSK